MESSASLKRRARLPVRRPHGHPKGLQIRGPIRPPPLLPDNLGHNHPLGLNPVSLDRKGPLPPLLHPPWRRLQRCLLIPLPQLRRLHLLQPRHRPRPAPPPPPAPKPQESPRGSGFIFNFDNADLYEVIRVIAEVLKLNYIIDPRVKGVVNIHTSGQVNMDDVFPVFQTILQLNGATAVKKGQIYEIVPFGDAKKLQVPLSRSEDSGKPLADEKYVIQVIPLKFIPVSEVSKIVKPFLSDGADIVEHPSQNILLLCDIASNIRKVLDLIVLFDIDLFTDLRVRIYPISHSDVNEIAKEMETDLRFFRGFNQIGPGRGDHLYARYAHQRPPCGQFHPQYLREGGGMAQATRSDTHRRGEIGGVCLLRPERESQGYGGCAEADLYPAQGEETGFDDNDLRLTPTPSTTPPGQPRSVRPAPTPATPGAPSPPSGEEGGIPTGEITIVVDETTNALIIRALSERVQICPRDDQETGPLPQAGIDRALPRRDHAR